MISFIVIGKNEGWRLDKCLSSIQRFVRKNISAIIPSILNYRDFFNNDILLYR